MEIYGLTDEEVKKSRIENGSNTINKTKSNPFLKLLLESLGDPMIKILLIVLALKIVFLFAENDWFETLGILIAIFLASFISSISEYGSNKAFESLLEKNNTKKVKVKRNKKMELIIIEDLVKNDIVYLANGDIVPADGFILDGEVFVDESCINGESAEVLKVPFASGELKEKNKLYKGTIIDANECIMKITSVGVNTLYGKIALELQEQSSDSPLKLRLRHLAKIISRIGYIGAFLVFFSYLFSAVIINNDFNFSKILITLRNGPLLLDYIINALTLGITIIIVSVPEGLPMMVALVLSTNMKKMIKQNILVRKMVGIETAGSLNYLLTDKTGTITNGKMSVMGIIDYNGKLYSNEMELNKNPFYFNLIGNSLILNNECMVSENKIITGNSTDKALYEFINFIPDEKIMQKEVFDSEKKYSSVTTKNIVYYKGASEILLPKCSFYYNDKNEKQKITNKENITNIMAKYMSKGYRIIMLAIKENDYSSDLIYLGFAILKDDIRKDAKEGIELIKKAGIKLIMITGDSLDTALYIAKEISLIKPDDICLTSSDLNNLTDEEIKMQLEKIKVIARAKPNDKSRLVKIISDMNYVVGMTGDGINDAPALKKASVGFAMGSGTEVAKEAADIIILDDNIKSISLAILYGRTIFKNIRKFIIFQLTMNICAMSLSIIGPFIGISTPVTSMQMLWINMIMDTLAGLAFAYEEPLLKYMDEKPKKKDEPIINKYMYNEILFTGSYSAILCLLFLKLPLFKHLIRTGPENKYFLTAFFALFVFMGIFNAFNTRTDKYNLFYHLRQNKVFVIVFFVVSIIQLIFIYYGGYVFRTYGLNITELITIILIALTVIPVDLIRKHYFYHKKSKEYL